MHRIASHWIVLNCIELNCVPILSESFVNYTAIWERIRWLVLPIYTRVDSNVRNLCTSDVHSTLLAFKLHLTSHITSHVMIIFELQDIEIYWFYFNCSISDTINAANSDNLMLFLIYLFIYEILLAWQNGLSENPSFPIFRMAALGASTTKWFIPRLLSF